MTDDDCPSAELLDETTCSVGSAQDERRDCRDARGRFISGNSGGGRPKGSRNRLTDVFISAIADDFAEYGTAAISRVRWEDPVAYLKIVGSFVPRELVVQRELEPNVDFDNISLSEFLELLEQAQRRQSLRAALAAAENKPLMIED